MLPQGVTEGVSAGYDQLWKTFIQPVRLEYHEEDLGPWVAAAEQICATSYGYFVRDDFRVDNGPQGALAVSFYYPLAAEVAPREQQLPEDRDSFILNYDHEARRDLGAAGCLLYLHSQGGCRLEGRQLVERCSEAQVCLCLFDFAGCGRSGGEFVSLGLFEKLQVERVLRQLQLRYNVGGVALWGRSMGAATAILFAEMRPFDVCAMVGSVHQVLDSPFGSMKKTVQDIAYEHYNLPSFLVNLGLAVIGSSIQERIHADVFDELSPFASGMNCSAPALFIVAREDGLVQPKRVRQLHEKYGSKFRRPVHKQLVECEGSHTDSRSEAVVNRCFHFLLQELSNYSRARLAADLHCSDLKRYTRIRGFADPGKAFAAGKLRVPFEAPARLGGFPRPLGSYARGLHVSRTGQKPRFREEPLAQSQNHSLQYGSELAGVPRPRRGNLLRTTGLKDAGCNKENQFAGTVPSEPEPQKPVLHAKLLHQHRLLAQIVEGHRMPLHPPPPQQKPKPGPQLGASFGSHLAAGNLRLSGNLLARGLRPLDGQQRSPKKSAEGAYHSFASYNPTSRLNSIDISAKVRPRAAPERDGYSSLNARHLPQTSSLRNFDEKPGVRASQYKPLVRPIPGHFFTESLNVSLNDCPRPLGLAATHGHRTHQSTNCFESLRMDPLDPAPHSSAYLRLTHGGGRHF